MAKSTATADSSAEIDAYLARVPEPFRSALESLRATVRAAAPQATEAFSYGVPAFKQNGPVVSYAAAKSHCALYVMSPAVMEAHATQLAKYDTSKGTIRFPPDKPLPKALVTKLVKARLAENNARVAARNKTR